MTVCYLFFRSHRAGTVSQVLCTVGENVPKDAQLVVLEEDVAGAESDAQLDQVEA